MKTTIIFWVYMKPVTKKKERYIMLNYSLIIHFATYMKKMVIEKNIEALFTFIKLKIIILLILTNGKILMKEQSNIRKDTILRLERMIC